MISRVAEGCFWLTRYLERVETHARLLDVHHALHLDSDVPVATRWRKLLDFTGQTGSFLEAMGEDRLDDGAAVETYLTWDESHPASLFGALRGARENARTVREIMSVEAWRAINDLWLWLQSRDARKLYERDRCAFYERMTRSTLLFHGVSFATMLHDEPFTFMKLGRAVERAGLTARILDTQGAREANERDGTQEVARCHAILRCCCAYEPFFLSGLHPLGDATVTRFLLFDRSLPRSVLYNLDEARLLLMTLYRSDPLGLPRQSRTALDRLRGELLQMNMDDVERSGIHETLGWTIRSVDRLCDAIHDDYLDPSEGWLRHCVRALELAGSAETPADRAA